jgi:Ricin-type beta-trefoil lectin domain-like
MKKLLFLWALLSFTVQHLIAAQAQWVHFDSSGNLVYFQDDLGNRLIDYSYAGYRGGGVALPVVPVARTVTPISGDDTANIQSAINAVAAMTPDANGFRGAVLLKAGTYDISGRLTLNANGVVLRGEGNSLSGTVLNVSKASGEVVLIAGSGGRALTGSAVNITDTYVPLGARSFNVSSSSGFAVGDQITVNRAWTQTWIDAIGMNGIWSPNSGIYFERTITAVSGNQITVDIPVGNPIEQKFVTGKMQHYTDSGRIQECGVENMYMLCVDTNAVGSSRAVLLNNCKNCWVHHVTCDTFNNGFSMDSQSKSSTIQDCDYVDGQGGGSARPGCYNIEGQLCLYQRCTTHGIHGAGDGSWILTTQGNTAGPDVFFRLSSFSDHTAAQLHARWAASQLLDSLDGSQLSSVSIQNLGTGGNGHGWTAGYSLAYNCKCSFSVEQPTVDHHYNWVIGGIGKINAPGTGTAVGPGTYDTTNVMVTPGSLYLAQLKQRLGAQAVENIGYTLFGISVTPGSTTITAGNSASFTINITETNDLDPRIALSISGLPSGASAGFSPSTVIGPGTSTMTVSTSASTPAGTYVMTVKGTCGNLTHATAITLVINAAPDFSLSASPNSITVTQGSSGTSTITETDLNGYSGTINLSASGLPAGVTASFNPASTASTSTLTLTAGSTAATGTAAITITGSDGTLTHTTSVTLTVNPASSGLPAGWSDVDIGTVGVVGSAGFSSGTFTINGSGSDIWGAADSFNYASQSVSGDVTVVARVATEENTSSWAKCGVMFRESTDAGAAYVGLYVTPSNGVSMQFRGATGAGAIDLARQAGPTAPYWVKLVRNGNIFTGYSSADGATWTQVGSTNVTMSSTATAGLAVCAHANTTLNTSTFDNVSVAANAPVIDTTAIYQIQNVASALVLNNQGSLTNGSKITQWSSASTSQNLQWKFIPTANGYYQINSVKSGLDAAVQSASTSAGAGIIQWSFGSAGNDQWKPVQNSDGSYTFINLHSGLVLGDPGSSTSTSIQMDQETSNGASNQKWNLLKQ